jgi:hypothetical protein
VADIEVTIGGVRVPVVSFAKVDDAASCAGHGHIPNEATDHRCDLIVER